MLKDIKANALIELARNSEVRIYHPQQEICKEGRPAQELIVLIDCEAKVLPSNTGQGNDDPTYSNHLVDQFIDKSLPFLSLFSFFILFPFRAHITKTPQRK